MNKVFQSIVASVFFVAQPAAYADSFQAFHAAVVQDDEKTVAALLARGFNPNTPNEKGEPPLVSALRDGKLDVAAVLIRHPELKPDAANLSGENALMMASLRGHLDWVRRLLDLGAAVNRRGWTPLHYAASGTHPASADIVRLLVSRGAEVNAPNPAGSTPIILAARWSTEDVARTLLQLGADPAYRNPGGQNAADAALAMGREGMAGVVAAR